MGRFGWLAVSLASRLAVCSGGWVLSISTQPSGRRGVCSSKQAGCGEGENNVCSAAGSSPRTRFLVIDADRSRLSLKARTDDEGIGGQASNHRQATNVAEREGRLTQTHDDKSRTRHRSDRTVYRKTNHPFLAIPSSVSCRLPPPSRIGDCLESSWCRRQSAISAHLETWTASASAVADRYRDDAQARGSAYREPGASSALRHHYQQE